MLTNLPPVPYDFCIGVPISCLLTVGTDGSFYSTTSASIFSSWVDFAVGPGSKGQNTSTLFLLRDIWLGQIDSGNISTLFFLSDALEPIPSTGGKGRSTLCFFCDIFR